LHKLVLAYSNFYFYFLFLYKYLQRRLCK